MEKGRMGERRIWEKRSLKEEEEDQIF